MTDLRVASSLVLEGDLFGHRVALATIGVGPSKAHQNTTAAIEAWHPDRVLNLGTCGALIDDIVPGDLCCVTTVFREGPPNRCSAVATLTTLTIGRPASIVTVDKPVNTPQRRAALAEQGAAICDMEASAIAAAAQDTPLSALKVVSDDAGGDPSDDVFSGALHGPIAFIRFKARAKQLVGDVIVPALEAVLDD
jgi:nucleoside phosphorylase